MSSGLLAVGRLVHYTESSLAGFLARLIGSVGLSDVLYKRLTHRRLVVW